MQNSGPAVSNVPSTADLPPLPDKLQFSSLAFMVVFSVLAVFCLFTENWLGAAIAGAVVAVIFVMAYLRYLKVSDLHQKYRVLKVMEIMVKTPVMSEEGNSIILTYIFPSPAIMDELRKLHNSQPKAQE